MERNKLARQIIDTCLEMTRLGLNQGTAGNVSVRYQDGMLITPTGIPYGGLSKQTGCQRGCSQSCRSLHSSFHS